MTDDIIEELGQLRDRASEIESNILDHEDTPEYAGSHIGFAVEHIDITLAGLEDDGSVPLDEHIDMGDNQ